MSLTVDGIEITNPNKVIYGKDNVTKQEVVNYYNEIYKMMIPHIKARPLSVIRCHNSIENEVFFKKHPTTEREYVEVFKEGEQEFFYINNKKQLISQAQFGTIEFHVWGSCVKKINSPNLMIFDLDPADDLPLSKLREGVYNLKSTLDDLRLTSFLKTSGGKGYHILVPFSSAKNWEDFGQFAKRVALLMECKWPKLYTSNIRKNKREGKIFVDWLRNSKGATCVAPYSLRARQGAPISWPILWKQLDKVKPNEVTIKNYNEFLLKEDTFKNTADT